MAEIAFLGLGQMGTAIASNLLGAGYSLSVWNRSRGKAEALAGRGARVAEMPAGAIGEETKFVITMVSDDAALNDVVFGDGGIAGALRPGITHVSMSTIAPTTAESLAVPMPLASLIHDRLTATVAKGAKDVDWTAFAREVSVNAGLGGD